MDENHALSAFLQHRDFRYRNTSGVIFYRMADGSFYVAAKYPGVKDTVNISLDFFQQFEDEQQFMSLVHIGNEACLDDVVVEDLYTLYQTELMDLVCTLKGKKVREMRFRKMGGMLWATTTRKKLHLVRISIDTPEDFIAYTKGYYKVTDN